MSSSNTPNSVDSSVSLSDLFMPFACRTMENPRVIDAELECREAADGTFHYSYKLRALQVPEHAEDQKSSSMNPSDSSNPLDIKFTLLTKDGSRSFRPDHGFNGSHTLRDVLLHFQQKIAGDTKDDFCPRFAMIIDKKIAPIRHEDLEMKIDQFSADAVEIIANVNEM